VNKPKDSMISSTDSIKSQSEVSLNERGL